MMKNILYFCLLAYSTGLMTDSENLLPSNVATIQGTPATFECGSSEPNNTISWYGQFYELDSEMDRCLYTGSRVTTDYQSIVSVEIVDNVSSLRINHTTLSIAGTYIIRERGVNRKNRAELIVLESEPVCITNHTSTDNTTLELSCSVSFRGNWAPTMEWREQGSVNVITSDVINQTMTNDSVSYSLTVPLNVSRKSVRYTCTTRFIESMRPSSTSATNVPNLTLVWTSPLVNFSNDIDTDMDQDTNKHTGSCVPSIAWPSVANVVLILFALVATIAAVVLGIYVSSLKKKIKMYECQLIKAGIKSEYLNFANPNSTLYTELERRSHEDPTTIEMQHTSESMDDSNAVSQLKNAPNQVYCEIIA